MTSSEDIDLLFKLLKTRNFHLVFAQFFHYNSIRQLVQRIKETYPELRITEIDLDKADVSSLRNFLTQAEKEDVVLFHNFNALLRKGNEELRIYLNQRRDALASHPITYIAFVDGVENMKKANRLMPDLWSFRSLVMELPLPDLSGVVGEAMIPMRTGGQEITEPVDMEEIARLEKRWRELLEEPEAEELAYEYLEQLLDLMGHVPDPRLRISQLLRLMDALGGLVADRCFNQIPMLLNGLGLAYSENGKYEKAIESFEKAVAIEKVIGDSDHPKMASLLNNLGSTWQTIGEYDKAIEYLDKALLIYQDEFGAEHPSIGMILNNLGMVSSEQGEHEKAIAYYEQALEIVENEFGQTHSNFANCLSNIGMEYYHKQDYDKAISYLQQALDIGINALGSEHPHTATALNNLGLIWNAKGEYDKAIGYLEQALAITTKVYGSVHPSVASSLNNIGGAWNEKGMMKEAIGYFLRALEIGRKFFGEEHPQIAYYLNNIGAAFNAIGFYEEAIPYLEKSLSIRGRFLGEEHDSTIATKAHLETARARLASQTPPPTT